MRAHECSAEIYRGRRRLNIKWWDLVKSRGKKIQSLEARNTKLTEALDGLVELIENAKEWEDFTMDKFGIIKKAKALKEN